MIIFLLYNYINELIMCLRKVYWVTYRVLKNEYILVIVIVYYVNMDFIYERYL